MRDKENGKRHVIRKNYVPLKLLRFCREIIKGQPPPCENLTFVEFYNATNPPVIFLEKSIPLFDSIDSCTWIGNWAIVGGFSGKLCFFSPFTSRFKVFLNIVEK